MTDADFKGAAMFAADEKDMLVNSDTGAWRAVNVFTLDGSPKTWRRACEGETSRDGLWVVGGSQWRYGC